jgi:protein tyrosine phosphatase (PTP) superfamily phosphohydrolase (DUF442 family)
MLVMKHLKWPYLGLAGLAVVCALLVGTQMPGCRYWAGPLPIGTDNNTRVASEPTATGWATPMEVPGVPNLHKVSDDLYRGAEPTPEGVHELAKMGVKTIIDLRLTGVPADVVEGTGITRVRIPSTAWQPETQDVVQFLQIVTDESRMPIYVHCRRGADRTGMMCAIYRVAVQGWTKDQAIDEMTHGGFGFYSGWHNLVRYICDLDIDQIKQQAAAPSNHN